MTNIGLPGGSILWIALILIVFVSSFFRYRTRASHHRMLEKLAEKGQTISPELLAQIESGKKD